MLETTALNLSQYRIEKAKELLQEANHLIQSGYLAGAINRSYYALFNAMRSLLALIELDRSSHAGVLSAFNQHFVKTGYFEKSFSKIASEAFEIRQDNDYDDFYKPTLETTQAQLENAKRFVAEVEQKRRDFIAGRLALPQVTEN